VSSSSASAGTRRSSTTPVEQPAVTRDRKDDYLVALARSEHVDPIVSGDRDLIDAGLTDPAVWTPRQLADRLPES